MTTAQKTFEVYTQLGILADCKSLSTSYNHKTETWEVWGSFQNANGRRNGRVAQFDDVADAVEFARLAGF